MANFKTHLTIGCLVSGTLSTVLLISKIAKPLDVILCFFMGGIGSVLPDIDADNSIILNSIFNFMAFSIAFLVMFMYACVYSLVELIIIWFVIFIIIKYFVYYIFTKLTAHRGIIHSVPAAFLFGFIAIIFLYRIFNFTEFVAWIGGFFLFLGCIVHLLIDELYSLNLFGKSVKASLGTAFKFGNLNDLKTSALIYIMIVSLFFLLPDYNIFIKKIFNHKAYSNVLVFPKGAWFHNFIQSLIWK